MIFDDDIPKPPDHLGHIWWPDTPYNGADTDGDHWCRTCGLS